MTRTKLFGMIRRTDRGTAADYAVRPGPDVLSARIDDRCVLLDLRREEYLTLDAVGSRIWAGIEAGAETCDVVAELVTEYDAPPEQVERDARAFVDELRRRRLVVRA
jgi:hypothetical protein